LTGSSTAADVAEAVGAAAPSPAVSGAVSLTSFVSATENGEEGWLVITVRDREQ
jgi:hypothetical protein